MVAAALLGACVGSNTFHTRARTIRLGAVFPAVDDVKCLKIDMTARHGPVSASVSPAKKLDRMSYVRFLSDAQRVLLHPSGQFTRRLHRNEGAAFSSRESCRIQIVRLDGNSETVFVIGRNLLIDNRQQVFETTDDVIGVLSALFH